MRVQGGVCVSGVLLCSQGNNVRDVDSEVSLKGTVDVFISLEIGDEREIGNVEREGEKGGLKGKEELD